MRRPAWTKSRATAARRPTSGGRARPGRAAGRAATAKGHRRRPTGTGGGLPAVGAAAAARWSAAAQVAVMDVCRSRPTACKAGSHFAAKVLGGRRRILLARQVSIAHSRGGAAASCAKKPRTATARELKQATAKPLGSIELATFSM